MADIGNSAVKDSYTGLLHASGSTITLADGTTPHTMSWQGASNSFSLGDSATNADFGNNASAVNIGSGATTIDVGESATTLYVGSNASYAFFGSYASTVDFGYDASTVKVGYDASTVNVGYEASAVRVGESAINLRVGTNATTAYFGDGAAINYIGYLSQDVGSVNQTNYFGSNNNSVSGSTIDNYFGIQIGGGYGYSSDTIITNVYGGGSVSGDLGISGNVTVTGEIYGAPYCIWAEESADVADGSTEYSFGNSDETSATHGIVVGWRSKLFKIGLDVEHSSAFTEEFQLAVLQNGTGVATGIIANGSSDQSSLTDVSSQNIIFEAGDIINFQTIQDGNVAVDSVRPVAWFKTIE